MSLESMIAIGVVILFALGFHEYAHAKFADMAGDPTPGFYGRVTLNPLNHLDPLGTIMIVVTVATGFGIGWGKPVPMDPSKMRNPRWDHFIAVIAGPISNIVQAVVFALVFRLLDSAGSPLLLNPFVWALLTTGVTLNLALCFFNMLPLGPLDGMWILGTFLPEKARFYWTRWNLQVGAFLFLALVLGGQFLRFPIIWMIIGPPIRFMRDLLLPLSVL
jgi:Zn-dependent protease